MILFSKQRTPSTRLAKPAYEEWRPHNYQLRAVDFLLANDAGALVLDPGLGKTSIVLEAFCRLKEKRLARKMLVVAPLRVCQLVWRQEGQKWTQFRDLTFTLLHGPKKEKRLEDDVDIYLINPEGVAWLSQQFYGRGDLPFDTVVVDELTKFKNHRAVRSKRLRKRIQNVMRCWGLTGSFAPNGYMDLFGQFLLLDGGRALGSYITAYRDRYFTQDYNGFTWNLREGAAEQIERKIAPYVLRMSAADYLELPPIHDNIIPAPLPPDALKKYKEMKDEMLIELPEGVVTGANAGAVYSKLKQLANGAVYLSDRKKEYAEIHSAKLDAVEDLVEELAGQPLLIAYEFQHDLERLRRRLGEDVPTLTGLSETKVELMEAAWNRGELPVLLVHPASAGHGLNLQAAAGSGTAHICWFSQPWDLELYDQTIRRLRRQGSEADRVINHIIMSAEMDHFVAESLQEKDTTLGRLLKALNAEILRDDPAPTASGSGARNKEEKMVKKLGFQGEKPAAAASPAATARTVQPKGWGAPASAGAGVMDENEEDMPPTGDAPPARATARAAKAVAPKGWGDPNGPAASEQQEAIRGKITAPPAEGGEEDDETPPASDRAMDAFPPDVVQRLTGDGAPADDDDDIPPAGADTPPAAPDAPRGRGRPRKAAPPAQGQPESRPAAAERSESNSGAQPRGWSGAGAAAVDAASGPDHTVARSMGSDGRVNGMLEIRFDGIPADALATLFESMARSFRNGG